MVSKDPGRILICCLLVIDIVKATYCIFFCIPKNMFLLLQYCVAKEPLFGVI